MGLQSFFSPPAFQGRGRTKNYFEGWYFKMVTRDLSGVFSFIPGISLSGYPHSFVQIINGVTGESDYIRYPLSAFSASRKALDVRVGANRFSEAGLELDIDSRFGRIAGSIRHTGWAPFTGTPFHPGIMGPFAWLPGMECLHGVNSALHGLEGGLNIGGREMDFNGGRGYSEKDWGRSMPKAWVWMQSNHFHNPGTGFMLSIARIPWMGMAFTGFLGFLYMDGRYEVFTTYNGSRLNIINITDGHVELELTGKGKLISIISTAVKSGDLKAPVNGSMDRVIKESLDAVITLKMTDLRTGGVTYQDQGARAGLETVGDPAVLGYSS